MYIAIGIVSGFMVGIEVLWGEGVTVLDLGIIRIYLIKGAKDGK